MPGAVLSGMIQWDSALRKEMVPESGVEHVPKLQPSFLNL